MRRLALLVWLLAAVASAQTTVTVDGEDYELADHPRVFLDGPAGTITARVKDPDGAGPQVAPHATDANPAFVAMKAQIDGCILESPPCGTESDLADAVHLMALRWYMDNSKTDHLAAAIYWLTHVEDFITGDHVRTNGINFQFGCDVEVDYCGLNSWSDWPALAGPHLAQAFSLVRSEMSAGEIAGFSQRVLNDITTLYEDDCTNQLQEVSGAIASFTVGSTTVNGSGFSGMTAGNGVYIKPGHLIIGGWSMIQTVNSDTQLTLTVAPQYALGGNYPTVSNGLIYERGPWTSSTCSISWLIKNHSSSPKATVGGSVSTTATQAITPAQTTLTVASAASFPTAPFYVLLVSETALVTEVNGNTLTLTRGQFGSAPVNRSSGFVVEHMRYLPNGSLSSSLTHNLVITKLQHLLPIGLALADDEPTLALRMVDEAGTSAKDVILRQKDQWTGFTEGGSSNYGPGRQMSNTGYLVTALKHLTPVGMAPSLDYTAGNWIKNEVYYTLYAGLPGAPQTNITWGSASVASAANYYANQWAQHARYHYPSDDETAYFNYWQRTATTNYTSGTLSTGTNIRMIPFALYYNLEADASTSYTSLPTEHVFNEIDGDGTGLDSSIDAWISRTGWTSSTDSLVFAASWAIRWLSDHYGTGAPGAYKVYKQGWTLGENSSTDTGEGANTNMILWNGAANMKSVAAGHFSTIDRSDSGTGWAFIRSNNVGAYSTATAVTRAQRNLIHFKKASSPDYLVVFDTAATSSAKTIGMNLHYDRTSGQTSSMTDSTLPSLVWTGTNRRMSTYVASPTGTAIAKTSSTLTSAYRETICASSDGSACASVTSAEFLIVHKPSTNVSDTMPTITLLSTIDSDFTGVQVEDGSSPSVAVFAEAGADQTEGSYTTTLSGTAQHVVCGLAAGTYDVVRGGVTTVLDDESVTTASGCLAFESVAGAFTITQQGAPPSIEITTTCPLSSCVKDQPCSHIFEYSGGTPPVTWTLEGGSFCTGQSLDASTGQLSGVTTMAQTCTFDIGIEDDNSETDLLEDCQLTVTAPPAPNLTVTANPGSTGVILKFGVAGLDAQQSCAIEVVDNEIDEQTGLPIGPVAATTSNAGRSTRVVSLGGLTAEHRHTATVACGSVASGQANFATYAAQGGTVSWRYDATPSAFLQALSAAKLTVEAVPAGVDLLTDLSRYWPLDEESGDRYDILNIGETNSWDVAGGTPGFAAGVNGNAVSVSATNFLSLATSAVFPSTTFTLSFWFNPTSFSADPTPIFAAENGAVTGIDVLRAGSKIQFDLFPTATAATTSNDFTVGAWNHVIVWFDDTSNEGGVQLNGGAPATFADGDFVRTSGTMGLPWASGLGAGMTGLIDEVKLWDDRVLSSTERTADYGTVSETNDDCATGCTVSLSLVSGQVYNIRHIWKTAADVVLATTQYAPIAVP